MELNFGERIKHLRRERDLTQEALADALGISAQSVSKWECAYGYPDITQLPAIANFFGVTIDELLGNDFYGKEEDRKRFWERLKQFEEDSEEEIDFIREYCRRYPDDNAYGRQLCVALREHILYWPENRDKYYALLRSTAEKLLEDVHSRHTAIQCMVMACDECDLEEWLELVPYHTNHNRRSLMIYRYAAWQDTEKEKLCLAQHNLEAMANLLDMRYPDKAGAAAKAAYHKGVMDTIASFGKDGEIPDGWLAFYAYKQLVYAACRFGMGEVDAGKAEFLSAMEKMKRFHSLTEEYLDTGAALFGGLRVDKQWFNMQSPDGEIHRIYGLGKLQVYASAEYVLALLTNPRWAWFNPARNEAYYKEAVQWLQSLAESE